MPCRYCIVSRFVKEWVTKALRHIFLRLCAGNGDGEADGVLRVPAGDFGADAGGLHEPDAPVHAVEEQPDVLDDIRAAAAGLCRLVLRDQTVYVTFGIGDVQLVFADMLDGGKALLRVLQTQWARAWRSVRP